jgi:hypothetical protein
LKDVRVSDARVEPLHIELMPLRSVVGGALKLDSNVGMKLHEPLKLLRNKRPFSSKSAAGERENGLV